MIVEFIGCTGAGKTTLIREVRRQLGQQAPVASSFEVVAARVGLGHITHPTVQNLIQEAIALPFFLGTGFKHPAFLRFVLQMMARQGRFNFYTFNYLRSIERTLGVYAFTRQIDSAATQSAKSPPSFIFVDEGTIVPAHNIFVYNDIHYSAEEINRYAELAPLPDRIVYVRAPIESLLQRTLQRPDPPREMRGQNAATIEKYVRRADAMFEQLVGADRIQNRLLTVDTPEMDGEAYRVMVRGIVEHLLTGSAAHIHSGSSSVTMSTAQ